MVILRQWTVSLVTDRALTCPLGTNTKAPLVAVSTFSSSKKVNVPSKT